MRKTITYSSFIIAGLGVALIFVTSKTYTQLGVAIILYPLLAYFAFKIFPRKIWKAPIITIQTASKPEKIGIENEVKVADVDKRAFLKLIGAAGASFFLFSLINRRLDTSSFLGRPSGNGLTALEDGEGKKINPAQSQPTDGYRISEFDDNIVAFYGFINKTGGWFIMKEDTDNGSFRYTKGESDFPNNWPKRESLKYDYYDNIF